MGATFGTKKENPYIQFEDVLCAIENNYTIINTIHENKQTCLICNTIPAEEEEKHINTLLETALGEPIIIYGENSADITVETKYKQLISLGFSRVYIYRGGLFEWILLQNIYGEDKIPTTAPEKDILKYIGFSNFADQCARQRRARKYLL